MFDDAGNECLVFPFRILPVENAVTLVPEANTTETVFRGIAVGTVGKMTAQPAIETHPHKVIPAAKTNAVVEKFTDTAGGKVHGRHAFLTRRKATAIPCILRINAIEALITVYAVCQIIADTFFAVHVVKIFPDRPLIHRGKMAEIFL